MDSSTRRPRRARGGIVALVGYLLSPLSWWNDAFINIPIAYVFATLVSLVYPRVFPVAMVVGYWLTNILGMLLLHWGGREALSKGRGLGTGERGPVRSSLIAQRSALGGRRLWVDLAIGTAYTAAIGALAFTGILKPPSLITHRSSFSPQRSASAPASGANSPIHFAREEIDMRVRPGRLELKGTYHFQSQSDRAIAAGIFYPFPLDSTHPYPDSAAIPGYALQHGDSGVMFRMTFPARSETSFVAWYRQPLLANSARYIVTTTRMWGRAIDRAEFRITVPLSFAGVQLSYRADRSTRDDSTVTYWIVRRNFYPDKDIVVTWR